MAPPRVNRRAFLRATGAAAAGAALAGCARRGGPVPPEPPRRPNVVFLLADQWRAQATGYAGDPNARTPHLDRLAARSVNVVHAVAGCPVCAPYRASLLTGRYPLTHGVFLNDVCLSTEAVSLADAFRGAGYRTAYVGKWHLDGHGRSAFIPPARRQGFDFWRAAECTHDYRHSHYYAGADETKRFWPGYDAFTQTDEACRYVRERAAAPFLLVLSWGPPHNPYETAPEEFRRLYRAEDLALRPNVPQGAAAAARRDLAGYYAHGSALDDCVGRVERTLAEAGLEDDTILVFTSDHGDMLGSQGEWRKQKPWDESIRVPLLVRWPRGLGRDGRRIRSPIDAPDVMPTLLGLCGIAAPRTVEGADRSALLRGAAPEGDDAALLVCPSPFGEWARPAGREYRGLRTARHTYVRTRDGPWLLYDNEADPCQTANLCGRPEAADLQADLDARLRERLRAMGDEFRSGWDYIRQWGYPTDASGTVPYTG